MDITNNEQILMKLREIPPSKACHLAKSFYYYPVRLRMINSCIIMRCIIVQESIISYLVPEDRRDQILIPEEIKAIIEDEDRIPPDIVQKICRIGETSMGGVEFKLIMNDNKEVLCNIPLGPGFADFLSLPQRYLMEDIKDVKAAARQFIQPGTSLSPRYKDLNWCAIDDALMEKVLNIDK